METIRKGAAVSFVIVLAGCLLTGCDTKGLVLGPYPLVLELGAGEIPADAFGEGIPGVPAPVTLRMDYCTMPTEEQIAIALEDTVGPGLASVLRIGSIELESIRIDATAGDFSSLYALVLHYIPGSATALGRVELGSAFSLTGFGSEVVLHPGSQVDLLDPIRENADGAPQDCPQLELFLVGTAPEQAVAWTAEAMVDVYVVVGGL